MNAESQQRPPKSEDHPRADVGWDASRRSSSSGGPVRGCAVRLAWAAFGYFLGVWASFMLVPLNVIGDPEDPVPDWPFVVVIWVPIVAAVAFGARGPAIVGSLAGRLLLIAMALAPFAMLAYLVVWLIVTELVAEA